MDGSDVIIAVYGQPKVGKTSFIANCLNINIRDVEVITKSKINICGRDINIQVMENPEQITRAVVAIMLYNISCPETFRSLSETFDLIHRLCPTAYPVVIGTKADLRTTESVTTEEAESLCRNFQNGNVLYYETSIHPPDNIAAIFKEILARPLINLAILKMATVQENNTFVHDTMDWALENGSANILTHLRKLGYAIPEDLVLKYQELVVSYLLQEYPLIALPSFKIIKKLEIQPNVYESELDENDEPMNIVEEFSSLRVTNSLFLEWSNICLMILPSSFLSQNYLPIQKMSHVNLSRNCLTSIPLELFLLPSLSFLNVSENQLITIPSSSQWSKTKLEILILSHNKITADATIPSTPKSQQDSKVFERLWHVDLSHNGLGCCPGWVMSMVKLKHLDLSHNQIHSLPSELRHLNDLCTLLLEDVPLLDPPPSITSLGTDAIQRYLNFKSISCQPLNCIRVVVVGPEKVGKTCLLNHIRGDNSDNDVMPTKGLEVTQWHYKGEILRRKAVNIDFWDFSGSPKHKQIYTCFDCQESLHLAVFSIHTETEVIIRWLSDIQSLGCQRVPVLVVFTHMDTLSNKETREELKRKRTEWLKYNLNQNQQLDSSSSFTLLSSTMTQAVKSLQDTSSHDRHSLYLPPQQAFDRQEYSGNNIPLMPLVLPNISFVSSVANEGISQLRKTLYRIGTGSFQSNLSSLNAIGLEIPSVYSQIVNLIKQLQGHLKNVKTEGEQKPFYKFAELQDRLRRPLKQLNVSKDDFLAALRFLHQKGLVYIYDHKSHSGTADPLIAINPQIIGYLLQRTIRAGEAHSENNILPGFLPNVHPNMIWGVDPIVNLVDGGVSHGISPTQLIDFLGFVILLAPTVPGACIVPSLLPVIPVRGTQLELNDLECKRVYLLGYLPSFFWSHAVTRILQGLKKFKLIGEDEELVPASPSIAPARPTNPLVTTTGIKLYLWQKNFVLEDQDGSILWVIVLEGGQLGPESTPFCGRIDILIKAPREKEALYIRVVTTEIDQLLKDRYPSLLDDTSTPLQVEIFIPLTPQWFKTILSPSVTSSGTNSSNSFQSINASNSASGPVPIPNTKPRSYSYSTSSPARSELSLTIQGTLQEAFMSIRNTGTLPLSTNNIGSPIQDPPCESEMEELSGKHSQLNFIEDLSLSPAQYLVPMWECLQEVYKPTAMQLKGGALDFHALLPDLLLADLPPNAVIPVPEDYMVGVKIQEARGMFMRYYYTNNNKYNSRDGAKVMGAMKTFLLQRHITKLGDDYKLLSSLSCPYIISPAGINMSPPVLGMGLSPFGSLRKHMAKGNSLLQSDIHQIGLQVLSAIEYLEEKDLGYHYITGDNIFLWCKDPVLIKMSDSGLTHKTSSCKLCADLLTTHSNEARHSKSNKFNLIMFGLILYEISVGKRPLEDVIPLSVLVLSIYHQKTLLNIEAAITHACKEQRHVHKNDGCVKACHVLCLQTVLNLCTKIGDITTDMIRGRLSLCAGEETWAPLKLTLDMECLLANKDSSLVYWASGSRGLVVGTIDPKSGELYRHILAEAPTPESGLFANRRGKPIPIAVGHATAIDVCYATNQLWVGTENGLMGSVYVFDLPDMKSHHYIHLQDAVLALRVVNDHMQIADREDHHYHVLVGLANGTIILFMGRSGGQPLKNPLQGPRKVIATTDRKPCLSIEMTSNGHFWCGCGNTIEVIDSTTLRSLYRHQCLTEEKETGSNAKLIKGDVIVLMGINSRGVWTVTRRSTLMRLWDSITGSLKATFSIKNVLDCGYNEISALLIDSGVVWIGTKNGYILLLDASSIEEGEKEKALRAIQYCGDGRVKSIASLNSGSSSNLKVLCSVEYPDEVSGCVMSWDYQSVHPWQPKERVINRSSMFQLQPLNKTNDKRCLKSL